MADVMTTQQQKKKGKKTSQSGGEIFRIVHSQVCLSSCNIFLFVYACVSTRTEQGLEEVVAHSQSRLCRIVCWIFWKKERKEGRKGKSFHKTHTRLVRATVCKRISLSLSAEEPGEIYQQQKLWVVLCCCYHPTTTIMMVSVSSRPLLQWQRRQQDSSLRQ